MSNIITETTTIPVAKGILASNKYARSIIKYNDTRSIEIVPIASHSVWTPARNKYLDTQTGTEYDPDSLTPRLRGHIYHVYPAANDCYVVESRYRVWDEETQPVLEECQAVPCTSAGVTLNGADKGKKSYYGQFRYVRLHAVYWERMRSRAVLLGWELHKIATTPGVTLDYLKDTIAGLDVPIPSDEDLEHGRIVAENTSALLQNTFDPLCGKDPVEWAKLQTTLATLQETLKEAGQNVVPVKILPAVYELLTQLPWGDKVTFMEDTVHIEFSQGTLQLSPTVVAYNGSASAETLSTKKTKSRLAKLWKIEK